MPPKPPVRGSSPTEPRARGVAEPVSLRGPDEQPAAGRNWNAGGDGLALALSLPPGRRLGSARLLVGAAEGGERPLDELEFPGLATDIGPHAGKTEALWQWARIDWKEPRALIGVRVEASPPAAGALIPPRRTGARLRLCNRGSWLPLAPLDTLPTGTEQSFPAQCASGLMAEMLIEGDAAEKRTGVLIPGMLNGRQIGLRFTRQPCQLSVAIGNEPPFFSADAPLPEAGLVVAGLARAINRYLSDHPGAAAVPLNIATANTPPLRIIAFEAELEAPPPPATPDAPPPEPTDQPRPGERALLPPSDRIPRVARLCDADHAAGLRLIPLPQGVRLSSVQLQLRNPGDEEARGTLSLHADEHGSPASTALVSWPIAIPADDAPRWVCSRLPAPRPLAGQPWWLVCRVEHGSLQWYAEAHCPDLIDAASHCRGSGPWLPLDTPAPAPWLHLQAGVLDPED